jgi:hypothetical protein
LHPFSQLKRSAGANRINKIQLNEDIKNLGYIGTGDKYGVADNTIKKWRGV